MDMAEYIFRTGDEKGVTFAVEEFLQRDLVGSIISFPIIWRCFTSLNLGSAYSLRWTCHDSVSLIVNRQFLAAHHVENYACIYGDNAGVQTLP